MPRLGDYSAVDYDDIEALRANLMKTTQNLIYFNGVIWVVFSWVTFIKWLCFQNAEAFLVLFFVANACMLFYAGWVIVNMYSTYNYLVCFLIIVNIVLTVTDQIGIFDILVLLLNIAIMAFLTKLKFIE